MFLDRAIINIQAGNGGAGAVSFRREKFDPKGGPDGGDGGKGGDVVFVAEDGMSTLYDFRGRPDWAAEPGESGGRKQCHGKNSADILIKLPPGTMIFNDETGELMHDLKPTERVVLAKGGKGGWGNEHYKSPTNQTPRYSMPGEEGQKFRVRLELKLIADVGLVGLPNAGKSTLLKALTRANPKIANYPFTTLSPQLGIAEVDPARRLVIADIPGLIEGASEGAGLGHDFLRHIERTRIIVHLLDVQPDNGMKPSENYKRIRHELSQYSVALGEKREIIALNKLDLIPDPKDREKAVKDLCKELGLNAKRDVLALSGAAAIGLTELLHRLWRELNPSTDDVPGWKSTQAVT